MALPTTLNAKDQQTFDQVSSLQGTAFDQAYTSTMIQDHQTDIASYRNEANTTSSDALRTYANQNLPVLQYHLALAQQVNASLPSTATTGGGTTTT